MKTGIHITACKTGSAELHNTRDEKYLEMLDASGKKTYDIYRDETHLNSSWVNPRYQGRTLPEILEDTRQEVKAKTGRAMQEKATPIREGVCPVRPDTKLSDFQPVVNWFAAHGAAVIRIDLHRDEGHTDAVTGERKHNHHAHLVLDFIDHRTGKSVKLSKQDTSELQTVLADALHMERGTSVDETGARHLAAQEYREKKAGENAARLEAKAAELQDQVQAHQAEADRARLAMEEAQQREATAREQAKEAEKAASREQLKSNLADVGARVAGLFGRGAVAEANTERDEAAERAEEAEQQAAADRAEKEAAIKAAKIAQDARVAAETAANKAKEEKAAYGREMYENGVADGIKQGRQSVQASIAPLQEQLAAKDAEIHQIQDKADMLEMAARNELQKAKNELYELKKNGNKEVENMTAWNPHMQNWGPNVQEMREAGMKDQDIQEVFMYGKKEGVKIPVKFNNSTYTATATVDLAKDPEGKMRVWFNDSRLKTFLDKCIQALKNTLGRGKGV